MPLKLSTTVSKIATIQNTTNSVIYALMSNDLLTAEEGQHKDEIIDLTEQVLDAKDLECDERISKLSEEKLTEILEEVRRPHNRRKKRKDDNLTEEQDKQVLYVR